MYGISVFSSALAIEIVRINYRSISLLSAIAETLEKPFQSFYINMGSNINTQHTLLYTRSATKSQKVSTIQGLHNAL